MKTKFLIPLAGLALFCACKGRNSGYEVVNNDGNSAADTSAKQDTTAGPKLVKTAGMILKVKDVGQTAARINVLAAGFGGMVIHQQMGSTAERSDDVRISTDSVMRVTSLSTAAGLTVKVPSVKLQKFMDSVATMGMYVTSRSLDVTDKTLDYLSAKLKLESRTALIRQQKTGKVIIKDPAKVLDLKDDMIDQEIDNRQIDDAVKYSVINLNFYQSNTINKEVIANDDPSDYNLPFFKRLAMALENGWGLFTGAVVGLANLWVFILAGASALLVLRYYKMRRVMGTVR